MNLDKRPIFSSINKTHNLGKSRFRHINKTNLKLLFPVYIIILVFSAYPLLRGIYLGFTNFQLGYPIKFNGFANYVNIVQSSFFWVSFQNLFEITFVSLPVIYVISFLLALILDSKLAFKGFWRTVVILPWAVPPITKIVIWKFVFNPNYGYANYLLEKLGFIKNYLGWTGDVHLAIYTIITVTVWGCVPFLTLCILAGLQSIPKDNYEAAKMDGARMLQGFWYITLPYCKNITFMGMILLFMWIMQDFPTQYLLTGGGPGTASLTPNIEAYQQGFGQGNFGVAMAYGNVLIVVMVFFIHLYTRQMLRGKRGEN